MRAGWVMFCAAALATSVAAAPRGYLRRLGPAPLRFLAAADPSAKAALGPLAMADVPAANEPETRPVLNPNQTAPLGAKTAPAWPAAANPDPGKGATARPFGPVSGSQITPEPPPLEPVPPANALIPSTPVPPAGMGGGGFVFPHDPGAGGLISPQMLVPYFIQNQGTNGPKTVMMAPATFAPPVPNLPLSSSATYLTPLDGTRAQP